MACKLCGIELDSQAVQCEDTDDVFCDKQCANIDWQTSHSVSDDVEENIEGPFRHRGRKIRGLTNFESAFRNLFEQLFDYTDKSLEVDGHSDNLHAWSVDKKQLGDIASGLGEAVKKFDSMLKIAPLGGNVLQHIEKFAWFTIKFIDAVIAKKSGISYPEADRAKLLQLIAKSIDVDEDEQLPDGIKILSSLRRIWSSGPYDPQTGGLPYAIEQYAMKLASEEHFKTQAFKREVYVNVNRLGYILDNAWRNSQSTERKERFDDRKTRFHKRRGGRGKGAKTTPAEDKQERKEAQTEPPRATSPVTQAPPLPADWEENTTDEGETYWHNTTTGESVWERPVGTPTPPPMPTSHNHEFVVLKPRLLPEDWYAVYDDRVRAYYFYNPVLSVQSWFSPTGSL